MENPNASLRPFVLNDDDFHEDESSSQSLGSRNNDSWMVAYLDLMTLLLALFVIMGALSHAKAGVSLQGKSETVKTSDIPGSPKTMDATIERQGQKKGMEEDLRRVIGSNSLGGVMAVKATPGLIRLQMDAKLLFPIGQAEMSEAGVDALEKVATLFREYAKNIEVEGHTDNTPMIGGRHHSNWSLSSDRAVSVVEKLIRLGVPAEKLHATAYADTRPLTTNATEKGRAKNRRVEFVVEMGPQHTRQRQ